MRRIVSTHQVHDTVDTHMSTGCVPSHPLQLRQTSLSCDQYLQGLRVSNTPDRKLQTEGGHQFCFSIVALYNIKEKSTVSVRLQNAKQFWWSSALTLKYLICAFKAAETGR